MNKILLVEDDPFVMEMLKDCLESQGYMIIPAGDGRTALNWVKESSMDLAIIDLGLPDMNGMQVCKAIKETPRTRVTPVIILTGNNSNEARIESRLFANADLFLNKPIAIGDLRTAVKKVLEESEREKRLLRTSIKFRLDGRLSKPGQQG